MSKMNRYSHYVDSIARTLKQAHEPLTLDALLASVEEQRATSKNLRAAVTQAIAQIYQAVPLSPTSYGWLPNLLSNNVFRHPLTNEEARRGFLLMDEMEHAVFFPEFFQDQLTSDRTLTIELFGGESLRAHTKVERKIWSLQLGSEFANWVDEQGGMGRDDVLISVIDAAAGRYQLRLQPREAKDLEKVERRNKQIARAATEIVIEDEKLRGAGLPIWELAARLIGRDMYRNPVPPDELHLILHKHSQLVADSDGKLYRQERFPFGDVVSAPWNESVEQRYSPSSSQRSSFDNSSNNHAQASDFGDWVDEMEWSEEPTAMNFPPETDGTCEAYGAYLESFEEAETAEAPLSHDDFHLLEAELGMLVELEQEFGYLLTEQSNRKDELADRLYIDPQMFVDSGWDDSDDLDFDDNPFWQN